MSFQHGASAKVYMNAYDVSSYLTSFAITLNGEAVDTTTFGATWHDVIGGIKAATFTANGFISEGAGSQEDVMNALINAVKQTMYFPQGDVLGSGGYGIQGIQTTYTPTSPIGGASTFTLNSTGKTYGDRIVSLHALGAETVDGDGVSVDNAASSANGGAGYLQVTAFSGFSAVDIKIQHSTDNSSWVDLITFTTVAAAQANQVVAVTGTVNRYLRYTRAKTGSGSITFVAGFGRR